MLMSFTMLTEAVVVGMVPGKHKYEEHKGCPDWPKIRASIRQISGAMAQGAGTFLVWEYGHLAAFVLLFGAVLLLLLGNFHGWAAAWFSLLAFVVGAATSMACGFVGMRIAVYANARTALQAAHGYKQAFGTSFKAGCVMGFALCSLALLVLFGLVHALRLYYTTFLSDPGVAATMYEALSAYGLGGSTVALFGRVGGGIWTKAADVGAHLVGKLDNGLPEDDPRNPAVIVDNVSDNVGDIAGMGADLFGSFCRVGVCRHGHQCPIARAARLVAGLVSAHGPGGGGHCGVHRDLVCGDASTACHDAAPDRARPQAPNPGLDLLMTPVAYMVCTLVLPDTFDVVSAGTSGVMSRVRSWHVFVCVASGLWAGWAIGCITEYFTSHAHGPVQEVAQACETGAATNIIYGLALGYKSVVAPTLVLAVTIYVSYTLAGTYGIATAALGILSPLAIDLAIDAYGPICDNAGGIAEMAHMPAVVRTRTDALDGAGNTTAAIGKASPLGRRHSCRWRSLARSSRR